MTVIRPNSVSGITSITAQANEINFFRSNGALAGLQLNGVNFNTTTGVSTFNNLDVGGVLTYQDVTNVDSLGIGTFRTGVNVSGGQLDVGSNIKLGNAGVITATSFVGSGANLTGLNSDLVNDSSPQLGGDLDTNSFEILLDDDHKIKFGDDADMNIRHTGSYGILENATGALYLRSSSFIEMRGNNNETFLKGTENGSVELYHNNTLRFETRANDVKFYDGLVAIDNAQIQLGNSGDIKLYHDGTNSYLDNVITGILRIRGNSSGQVEIQPKGGQYGVNVIPDAAVELYHSGTKKFETTSDAGIFYGKTTVSVNKDSTGLVLDGTSAGTSYGETGARIEFLMLNEVNQFTGNYAARISPYLDRGNNGFGLKFDVRYNASTTYKALDLTADYEVLPGLDNTISLGNSSYRWSNIYSADLQLSNIGTGGNEVDGTEGSWTLQEAEDTVYMINRINGKRYKIKMEEV